jgi:aminopeptidase N
MLRNTVGDALFFASVRDYYQSYQSQAVETTSLIESFNKVCKRDLSWFFDQWLLRPGCPKIMVKLDSETGGLLVVQSSTNFRFDLLVRYKDADEKIVSETLLVPGTCETIYSLGEGAHDLEIDPDVQLLFILE